MPEVRYKTVSINVYPWRHPSGREYWRFMHDGKHVTRSTEAKAKSAALKAAQQTYRGQVDLAALDPDQTAAVKRMLEADPSLRLVDEFLAWRHRHRPAVALSQARLAFLDTKASTAGHYHRRNLARYLSMLDPLAERSMGTITVADLRAILPDQSPRTQKNIRETWVTFWRWAARNEMLEKDLADVPAILDLPPVSRGIPDIFTPAELKILLANVTPHYLPWLALSAFAGVRTEEVAPIKHSAKPALDWSDCHWDRDLLIVRPETSKTGRRRVVPILPALAAWLRPLAKDSGRMSPRIPPSAGEGRAMAETTRLGNLIGGWKRNALRHSWITYRAALVGISQTAMEAGNSESESRRSYVDAHGADMAAEWFAVMP